MSDLDKWLDMSPPCDLEAEQAVLGAILLEPDVIDVVREKLQGREFFDKAHAKIFRAMIEVCESEKPLDLVTLTARLQDRKELDQVGGVSYLMKISEATPTAANVAYYAERVVDMFMRRETVETAMELLRQAMKQPKTSEFMAIAETAINKLSERAATVQEFKAIREVLLDVMERAETRYNNRHTFSGVTGISSGYAELDRMTAGFQKGDLIIVAARPSVGKTAFALNIAQNVAVRGHESVAIFSLEMSAGQLADRMVCAEGHIDAGRMRTGFFEGEDWMRMSEAVGQLSEAQIYIDDTPGVTVSQIRSKCRRLKKERGLGMVVIDYLQLITFPKRPGVNRTQEVTEITRMLKLMARELDVPVIALSQLSRGVEQRQDKRPMMSDLRESGSIEQDADIVAFLYRDDYYDRASEKKNIIEIIIAKQRNGPVGTVELAFLKNYNKFVNLDRTHSEQQPQRSQSPRNDKDGQRRRWA